MEGAAPPIGQTFVVDHDGRFSKVDVRVERLQVDAGAVVGIADVVEQLQQLGHAASFTLRTHMSLHRAQNQCLLLATGHATQHRCQGCDLNAVVQQATGAMALHSIDIQCVDARIPEGVEHALLLGGPVRRCEARGPAVAVTKSLSTFSA
eukprot:CAMPEP_0177287604 /NCGR_PEP_ID=MMETSP0367-20130122/74237_1 /TAXON_ID=447022 ORGANISM="Scrippsiella hangoei-like, Strain SHHI-4" /NCGR_SAMPLE_ID=MMETSP0367 /ASSEMBLY_ACC=CAM_ASM_000362 /LENGTH=149 /DNA_ID=CAMNT_0018744913 /DNA_START=49 /DNA_END=498 /DNA_ORIENTATION=-